MMNDRLRPGYSYYTFDVFDTVLVRKWARPQDLFFELGSILLGEGGTDIGPERFMQLRILAEKKARRGRKNGEIAITDIYRVLSRDIGLDASWEKKAMQMEIGLEKRSVYPVPGVKIAIDDIRKTGKKIYYISDMYLPSGIIIDMLKENKLWDAGDRIFVSGERGCNKSSGGIYDLLFKDEGLVPGQGCHTGDDHRNDLSMARRKGMGSVRFTDSALNRYEKMIAEDSRLDRRFSSLLSGTSRLCRLSGLMADAGKKVIWDCGCSVAGPVLLGYVYWCLQEAMKLDLERLYFVSREGQILKKIAEILCRRYGIGIECRYLYGSRHAWHFPAISGLDEDDIGIIFDHTDFMCVNSVFRRVNTRPEDFEEILKEYGFSRPGWDKNLDEEERIKLRQVFRHEKARSAISALAGEYRRDALGYLRQEGLFSKKRWGLVDMGWKGRMQYSLGRLLQKDMPGAEDGIKGFYFGLDRRDDDHGDNKMLSYLIDVKRGINSRFTRYIQLLELFTSADHGLTLKYGRIDGRYVPVLREDVNEEAVSWGIRILQDSAARFAGEFANNCDIKEDDIGGLRKASALLLDMFFTDPAPEEAEVFGKFIMGEDQTEYRKYEIAPVIKKAGFLKAFFLGGKYIYGIPWLEGSAARSFNGNNIVSNLLKARFFMGGLLKGR